MKTFVSDSLDKTKSIVNEWFNGVLESRSKESNPDQACIVGLSGHLGAGKTAFVKALAEIMGIKEDVTSPTFVIMKIYSTKNQFFSRLIHIDAYRLEKKEELQAIEWEKLVSDPRNLIMVEWPENVSLEVMHDIKKIHLEIRDQNRIISIS